jgi:murein DD-endopeptidase MepM/ murein hydrolase activator NlpD
LKALRFSVFLVSLALSACPLGSGQEEKGGQDMPEPIIVDFPLRGVWITPNSPGSKVPSHGTARFGEAYAIDFVMIDVNDKMKKFYDRSFGEYVLRGVPLSACYGWGERVYAPVGGEVIRVVDGIEERDRVNVFRDFRYMRKATRDFLAGSGSVESMAGNYVMLKCSAGVYALFAHLKRDSIAVRPGQIVSTGQALGEVGHSGNSMAPHLHMQFMDSDDLRASTGLPFVFGSYAARRGSGWITKTNSLPTVDEVITGETSP